MGFIIHFYTIFGTNLLTGGPSQIAFFLPIQCFKVKGYQTESKRNETFGNVIFGTNVIQRTWSGRQAINEEATRQGGRAYPLGAPSTLVALLTDLLRLYILIYPRNIRDGAKTPFTPPQPSVSVRSHLGAFSGAPPDGESITEGFYIIAKAYPTSCE